jgi:hypothetical protein
MIVRIFLALLLVAWNSSLLAQKHEVRVSIGIDSRLPYDDTTYADPVNLANLERLVLDRIFPQLETKLGFVKLVRDRSARNELRIDIADSRDELKGDREVFFGLKLTYVGKNSSGSDAVLETKQTTPWPFRQATRFRKSVSNIDDFSKEIAVKLESYINSPESINDIVHGHLKELEVANHANRPPKQSVFYLKLKERDLNVGNGTLFDVITTLLEKDGGRIPGTKYPATYYGEGGKDSPTGYEGMLRLKVTERAQELADAWDVDKTSSVRITNYAQGTALTQNTTPNKPSQTRGGFRK